ncbi:MAG: tetratricopeptide repeat protein [Pseudomonadota bacterium]
MSLLSILLPLAVLQANPANALPMGTPDELINRPPRPTDPSDPIKLTDPNARWLQQCLTQLESDAARAHAQAQIKLTGALGEERVIANHCLGLAATELGLWTDAETAFTAARDETPEDQVRARARFGAMAGNAALGGGNPTVALPLLERAQADAETASSAPLQVIAAMDRARALVALGRGEEALTPIDTATTLAPEESEGWLLKATLLRRLERLDDAQAAIERAVELAPQESAVGLEAGVIAVLSGREEAARASWQSVIDVQPDSLAAETARGYLAQLGPAPTPAKVPAPDTQPEGTTP